MAGVEKYLKKVCRQRIHHHYSVHQTVPEFTEGHLLDVIIHPLKRAWLPESPARRLFTGDSILRSTRHGSTCISGRRTAAYLAEQFTTTTSAALKPKHSRCRCCYADAAPELVSRRAENSRRSGEGRHGMHLRACLEVSGILAGHREDRPLPEKYMPPLQTPETNNIEVLISYYKTATQRVPTATTSAG